MGKKGLGTPVDPVSIPPSTRISDLDSITAEAKSNSIYPECGLKEDCKPLECPRRAWFERHMYLGKSDNLNEDLLQLLEAILSTK